MPPVPERPCSKCWSRKKKCDRQLPECSLCVRIGIPCVYPKASERRRSRPQTRSTPPYAVSAGGRSPPHGRTRLEVISPTTRTSPVVSGFPAVFYLDQDVFRSCKVDIREPHTDVPKDVLEMIGTSGDWLLNAERYFDTAHSWLPIIAKNRFLEHMTARTILRPDDAILVLCMGLIMWAPQGRNPRTNAYLAAKHFFLDLEIAGLRNIQVLQAGILIAIYEFGHAIYPAAEMSIHGCVAFGRELGIDWDSSRARKPFAWVDAEEQNRVWWAVMILDRIRLVGSPNTSFLISDPLSDVRLPAEDTAWNDGTKPPDKCSSMSPISFHELGRFSLTAEATRLLGRVLLHIKAEDFHSEAHNEEAQILDRALKALENVVHVEGHRKLFDIMNQGAMCSLALVILQEAHISKSTLMASQFESVSRAKQGVTCVIESRKSVPSSSEQRPLLSCVQDASPFMTTLLYQTAIATLQTYRRNRSPESLEHLTEMKAALRAFARRWKVSGSYLEILEAREMSQVP